MIRRSEFTGGQKALKSESLSTGTEGYYSGIETKVVSLSLMEVKSPRENGRGIRYGD